MKSATPKVLHAVAGRSLLGHVIEAASTLEPHHLVVVVGHGRDAVSAHVAEVAPWARHHRAGGAERHRSRRARRARGPRGQGHLHHRRAGRRPDRRHPAADRAHARVDAARARVDGGLRHRAHRAAVRPHRLRPRGARGRRLRRGDRRGQGRRPRTSAASTRSTPGCTPSPPIAWSPASAASPPTTRRARSTSPTSSVCCARTATSSPRRCAPTRTRSSGSTTACSSPQAAALMRDRINESWMRQGVAILDPASTWLDVDVDLAGRRRDPAAGHDARADVGRHRRRRRPGHDARLLRGRRGRRGRSTRGPSSP